MTGKQIGWLIAFVIIGAGNAALGQLYIDLGAGRIPVSPAMQPYIPTITVAMSFVVGVVGSVLPSIRDAGKS